jgi:hypothetical protein
MVSFGRSDRLISPGGLRERYWGDRKLVEGGSWGRGGDLILLLLVVVVVVVLLVVLAVLLLLLLLDFPVQ